MDDKARVKYFYEVVTSQHRLEEFHQYVAQDCTVRTGETVIPAGLEGMMQHAAAVRGTYPDLTMTITRQYCDGDTVISEFIARGTHQGEWLGMKPTGKQLIFTGVDVDKVLDGKIVEHSGAMNTFETLFQEGIIRPA